MKEAWAVEGSIPLPNHRHAVFLAFLEFLYTDKVRRTRRKLLSPA